MDVKDPFLLVNALANAATAGLIAYATRQLKEVLSEIKREGIKAYERDARVRRDLDHTEP